MTAGSPVNPRQPDPAPAARPVLTASTAARLILEAGVPCVTLVPDDAAAAAIPAAPREEGLRVVEGSMPVRIAYPIPPAGDDARPAALRRRDSHVLWLYDWAGRYRWSAHRAADDEWITISPEPRPSTYTDGRGREICRATGLPVTDENPGRWVTLEFIEDPDALADQIAADVAASIANAGKLRASREYLGQFRLRDAERIRAAGPRASCDHVFRGSRARREAEARLKTLDGDGEHGVRYEARPITGHACCMTCMRPVFEAGGRWWHEHGDCRGPRKIRDLPTEPGDWEFTATSMTCGYCGLSESWPEVQRSWVKFTGVHSLGVQVRAAESGYGSRGRPGDLVVLAEVEWIVRSPGERDALPHYCAKIPGSARTEYADDIAAALARAARDRA